MQDIDLTKEISSSLERIAQSLELLTGQTQLQFDIPDQINAFHWDMSQRKLTPIPAVSYVPLSLLRGLDSVVSPLLDNSVNFARGHGANNALLWGARGMGKSSLVKAIHAEINAGVHDDTKRLILIEINREELDSLPLLLRAISEHSARFIVFCDDLSFDNGEVSYKSLKSVLDGGLEGRPDNVVFYATSNRRHLMPRDMIENERSTAINPSEAVEEKVSLSDRFGLWLGFYNCDQDTYLEMLSGYVEHYKIPISPEELRARAIEWSQVRGARSGRVAIQLIRQLAGEAGRAI